MSVAIEDIGNAPRGGTHVKVTLGIAGGEDEPLKVLSGISKGVANIERRTAHFVQAARKKGHTWEEIGQALGVSRQAAWEKYSAE